MTRIVQEIRARGVLGMLAFYIVAAWVAIQVASEASPALDIPDAASRYVWAGALLGFPLAVFLSWKYDITALIDAFEHDMAYQIAGVYAYRGEIESAFGWLERAYDERDAGLTSLKTDPLVVNLHDDPRWPALLTKLVLGD